CMVVWVALIRLLFMFAPAILGRCAPRPGTGRSLPAWRIRSWRCGIIAVAPALLFRFLSRVSFIWGCPSCNRTSELRRARFAVGAGFFLQGLVFAAIVTQTPRFKVRFDIGDGGITAILVVVAVISGFGSVLAGSISQRYTSAVAFRAALLWIGIGAIAVGVAPNLASVVGAFAAYGLGAGGVDGCRNMPGY